MQSNQSNDRVSGRLTYLQNFLLVCLIFFISLLPIVYFWITTHLEQIRRIDSQIFGIEEELLLKNFFMQIEDHRLISRFYLAGNEAYLPKLRESESDIRETLSRIISLAEKNPDSSDEGTTLLQRIDPSKVLKTWQTLSEQPHSPLTIDRSEVLHTTLLQNLEVEFAFLTSRIGIRNAQEKADYALAENLSLRFPFLQENLSLFTLLETQTLLKKGSDEYEERILILLDRIEFDLDYLKKTIEAIRSRTPTLYNATVSDMWIRFYSSAIGLIDFSEAKRTAPLDLEKLLDRQKNSRAIGSALWEGSLNKLKEIFLNERTQVVRQLWSVSLLTLFLGSLAFILGILVTRRTNAGLVQLTQATESFTAGNLDARVPEEFDDEVGRQARAFNRMAQKLQEMLGFLYELLHATKELAAGNLKERLRSDRNNPEFDEVAESFNRMAAKFEEIIGKLQQMAMTLTRSAGEIEKTSQDEENSIVNQEKTTKDIAREANRIYSGAREFAKTIGEITVAADQTADLTQTAKESIHHIESIMHRMIDSSGHIAARLAILNAKAENITSIVTAITKVAERTNLLSLNASIEAEKAGEYGKGFAVIAREIRRLADQTAGSGLDIEKIVGEMMNAVASTVSGVQDFTAKIREGAEEIRSIGAGQTQVISRVQDFTSRFDQINRGMQIHSEGANEINRAIIRLTEKAGETTAAVHRLRSTIQELHNASGALHTLTHSLTKSPPEVQ